MAISAGTQQLYPVDATDVVHPQDSGDGGADGHGHDADHDGQPDRDGLLAWDGQPTERSDDESGDDAGRFRAARSYEMAVGPRRPKAAGVHPSQRRGLVVVGQAQHHGGNVQVVSAPDGWPLWVSDVRPGREHDLTCAHRHGVIATLTAVRSGLPALADLGYEGAADVVRVPVKKKAGQPKLGHDEHIYNKLLRGLRGVGERANALLTITFKALRRVSLDPWRIGKIVQAALVLLNQEHNWTMSASHNVIFSY